MKLHSSSFAAWAVCVLIFITFGGQTVINASTIISVNISDNGGNNDMASGSLAGATERVGNWNNLDGSNGSLAAPFFADGTAVGGSFSVTENLPSSFTAASGASNDALMFGAGNFNGVFTSPNPGTISLANIPFAVYDLYVYVLGGDSARGASVSLDGGTNKIYFRGGTAANNDGSGYVLTTASSHTSGVDDVPEANYTVFSGLSDTDVDISVVYETYSSNSSRGGSIYGFQLVAVPEPSTWLLLVSGVVSLFWLRRRR
jgi:hypothetical protein